MTSEHRLHPASVLFGIGQRLRELALPLIVLLFSAGSVGIGWQVWMLVGLVPYTIVAIGRTLTFRYRYDEHELVIRTGLLFRNERHVPYARIQNVDGVQTVFHRMLKAPGTGRAVGGGRPGGRCPGGAAFQGPAGSVAEGAGDLRFCRRARDGRRRRDLRSRVGIRDG